MRCCNRWAVAALAVLSLLAIAGTQSSWCAEPRQLTADGLLKRDPVYIQEGRAILYSVRFGRPRMVLMQLDVKTGESTRFHPDSALVEFRPVVAPEAQRMTFLRMTGNDQCGLFLENLADRSVRPLTTARNVTWNAAITPDGLSVIYNLSGQLYRQSVKDGKETKLTETAGRNDWPVVSPDAKKLAFVSSRDGDYELYVMTLGRDDARRITTSRGMDIRPNWSPDSAELVFTSNRDGNYEIYRIRIDGTHRQRLTTHPERDDYAAWHPDGKRIVTVSERDGRFDLFELELP